MQRTVMRSSGCTCGFDYFCASAIWVCVAPNVFLTPNVSSSGRFSRDGARLSSLSLAWGGRVGFGASVGLITLWISFCVMMVGVVVAQAMGLCRANARQLVAAIADHGPDIASPAIARYGSPAMVAGSVWKWRARNRRCRAYNGAFDHAVSAFCFISASGGLLEVANWMLAK